MTSSQRFSAKERSARSRLAQLLHTRDLVCGSIVSMSRRCGKAGCHCAQGQKHVSLYLSAKIDGKRQMIYLPPELEDAARQCVAAWREAEQLTQVVSSAALERLLKRKGERKTET